MANLDSIIVRSFVGGELAPSLSLRADLEKYTIGLRECRNFVVQRHGGVANRAGTRFVNNCKDNTGNVQLLRYVAEADGESVLIEAGNGYLRFYRNGGLVTVDQGDLDAWSAVVEYIPGDLVTEGGVAYYCTTAHTNQVPPDAGFWYPLVDDIYEIPSPFVGTAYRFKWTQSGRVITLTHRDVQPHDLVYQSIIRWTLVPLVTAPKVATVDNLAVDFGAASTLKYAYRVTAAAPGSYEEGESGSVVASLAASAPTESAPHEITWDVLLTPAVTGDASPEYYVYCDPNGNGTFGYIGTATGANAFFNTGIIPDFTVTPPLARELFTEDEEKPECSAYHQQRRFLANTDTTPDAVYGSRVGFPDNFGLSSPLQDDDALTFRVAGNSNHAVHWMLGLKQLILLTGGGEWAVGRPLEALTPSDIPADQETYMGIHPTVRPAVVGNSIIYLQARGAIVRDLQFNQEVEGLAGRDLTIFATHLFDGKQFVDMDYAQTPHSIVWAVRNDGTLLGLTYNREQDIMGWHKHDTQLGGWTRICVVPEAGEDVVYLVAGRTINETAQWFIEKIETRTIDDYVRDSFFVDAGLSYIGDPVTSVSGLDHLEGQVVAVLADGVVLYNGDPEGEDAEDWTVTGGAIQLGAPYGWVHVGLAITAQITTLDLDVNGTDIRTKKKRVQALTVQLDASARTFQAGSSLATLQRYRQAATDPADEWTFSGPVEMSLNTKWEVEGRLIIRQTDPTPITVLGVTPHVEVGG